MPRSPRRSCAPLPAGHPILSGGNPGTEDLSVKVLRHDTRLHLGPAAGGLRILTSGKGHVILAPFDVTEGMLDASTLGIEGYEPAYAQALVKNLIFWTLDGQADAARTP